MTSPLAARIAQTLPDDMTAEALLRRLEILNPEKHEAFRIALVAAVRESWPRPLHRTD